MNRRASRLLNLIKKEPYRIAIWSGFSDFRENPHNEWMKKILFNKSPVLTLQAHRGSYKTTALSVCVALFIVLYPSKNILLVRKTENDIVTFVMQVRNLLKTKTFQEIARTLYGVELELRKETGSAIDTNLHESVMGAYQFDTLSLTGSLTGKHADVVITDDIVTIKDRVSTAEREQTKRQYMELQNVVNRWGRIINTGTPWHKEDAFTLMGEAERYDIHTTGMITPEEEKRLRQSMGPSLFAANYELKHIADEEAMFTAPRFYEGDPIAIYDGLAHIDAAYGGGDYTAFTIAKEQLNGDILVFGKLWQKHVDDCLEKILGYHKAYRAGTIHSERNADKGYLKKELVSRCVPAANYNESMNKYIKISTFLRSNWERVCFLRSTDPEYIQQILDYTENAEHDDAPDSLSSVIRKFQGKARFKSFDF